MPALAWLLLVSFIASLHQGAASGDALLVKGHMSAGSNTISQAPRLGVPDPACTVGVGILDGVPLKLDYALAGPNESSSGSGTFTLSETSKPSFTGPVNADGFSCVLTVNVDGTIRLEQTLPAGIAVNTDIPQCTFTLTGTDSRVPSFNFGRPESNTLSATFNVQGNSFTIVMQSLPRIYALNGPLTESLTARLTGATAGGQPTSSKDCCTPEGKLKTGNVCRVSKSPCRLDARCDGVRGDCPDNLHVPDHESCPWYPATPHSSSPYYTESSTLQRYQPTPEEATTLAAASHSYHDDHYWPTCMGKCFSGFCALRRDHPTCCVAHKAQDADAASKSTASTSSQGHWFGRDLYCWK